MKNLGEAFHLFFYCRRQSSFDFPNSPICRPVFVYFIMNIVNTVEIYRTKHKTLKDK